MKKHIITKGLALGLLISVLLAGAVPALAGYIYIGNFYDIYDSSTNSNGFADFTNSGIDNKKTWSSHTQTPLFQYTQNNKFYVNGTLQTDETKDEDSSDGWGVWNESYEYVIIKQGNYNGNGNSNPLVDLYKYSDNGTALQNLSKYADGGQISHISGYNSVPIPGAVWLLGSGLFGLVCVRRRKEV